MAYKKLITFLISLTLISSCGLNTVSTDDEMVAYAGALKNIMHKGDLSSNIVLSELRELEDLYALGAMTNLKGEIQIFDGVAYNSIVVGDSLVIESNFEKEATLLVYAHVKSWKSVRIPDDIGSRKQLEDFIYQKAKEDHIKVKSPFPFLLEGEFKSLNWHVINWPDGDTEHSHEKHVKSGLYGQLNDVSALMLGFYSKKHKGIFTHHTADTHMHFKLGDNTIAGHVDDLELNGGAMLKLPVIEPQ